VAGYRRRSSEARRFDTYQLDDLREFAVRFNNKISDAFTRRRDEFRAKAGVSQLEIMLLDFRDHLPGIFRKFMNGHAVTFVVVLAIDILCRWTKK